MAQEPLPHRELHAPDVRDGINDQLQPDAKVWADVGGTFTDCFVTTGAGVSVTKVLSSGLVRATLLERLDVRTLKVSVAEQQACEDFWVGARVSRLDENGRPIFLGRA